MKISPNSSSGPDGVSALLLRNCVNELKKPIFLLWRESLSAGKLPKNLKYSIVSPVHKGGNRCEAENYRPISLQSHISKIFERNIAEKLTKYLEELFIFNDGQHDF